MNNIKYILNRLEQSIKVSKLNIDFCETDADGHSVIKLKDDFLFAGNTSIDKDKKYYSVLSKSTKKKVPFESFRNAIDINIRYIEGGLMYGGPKKNSHYTIQPGDTVSEMGAFRGFHILKLSKEAGDLGKVLAIEPMPDNLVFLNKNMQLNNIKNCIVVPKGVWDKPSTIKFNRIASDSQSGSMVMENHGNETIEVPVDSLDNICSTAGITQCDFMVIQLNGVEINALQGLTAFKPKNLTIAARYDQPNMKMIPEIVDLLENRGYKTILEKEKFVYANLPS